MMEQKLATLVHKYRDAGAFEIAIYRREGCEWAYAATPEAAYRRIESAVRGRWENIHRIVFEENTPRETLLYEAQGVRNH